MEKETLLEKYLQETLTEAERREFKELLANNPDFKEEVEFQTDVKRALTAEEDEHFREVLADFESEARAEKKGAAQVEEQRFEPHEELTPTPIEKQRVKSFPTKWLVAASIALLVGLVYFFSLNQSTTPENLFAENFSPYRNVTHPITRGEASADRKTQAFLAYSKGNYEESLPLFTELYDSNKEPYNLFYQANALIQLNRAGEAVPLLQEHLETDDSLTDKSHWYLAMAYLQMDDIENAKKALTEVVETNGYKVDDARRLLDEL